MRFTNPSPLLALLAASASRWGGASAFLVPSSIPISRTGATASFARRFAPSSALRMGESSLPTVEQASKDPFMKQLSHAYEICALLESSTGDDTDEQQQQQQKIISDLLRAQLSHSDGIRGFFATYLTGEGSETAADRDEIPRPLVQAMDDANPDDLMPLACMNVIMPTAMSSMHTDPGLQASAAKTAERGKRILASLKVVGVDCDAIAAAATGEQLEGRDDEERVQYWNDFFDNYDYKEEQRQDIAKAMQNL